MNHFQRRIVLTGIASVALLLSGCHKKSGANTSATAPSITTNGGPAPTATFTAEPAAIDLGQSVVINWRTTGATGVIIDGLGSVNVNGTQTVTPSNSTNFHLTARGEGGMTEANVRVTVRVPVAPSADNGSVRNLNSAGEEAAFRAAVQDVYFDYDSYDLRPDATTGVAQAASFLNAHPAIRVMIGGYADERGSAEYNLALGENRANAAKTAIVNAGVSAGRIRVISYGKEKQFCTEQNETCWQQNRRAQFNLDR